MNKYKCPLCGGVSYSAADPEALLDDKCLECDGRVKLADVREQEAQNDV